MFLADEQATEQFGRAFARAIIAEKSALMLRTQALVVFFEGTLGAGKTALCRAILRELGHSAAVKSPTYTLVEPYSLHEFTVYHFDLYRLADAEELEYIGIRDYFSSNAICLVEWPQRGAGYLPEADLFIELSVKDAGRELQLTVGKHASAEILRIHTAIDEGTTVT